VYQHLDCGAIGADVSTKPIDVLFVWLALSGGAFLLEKIGQRPTRSGEDTYMQSKGDNNGLLRPKTVSTQHHLSDEAEHYPSTGK
jgi:hypothetical protein